MRRSSFLLVIAATAVCSVATDLHAQRAQTARADLIRRLDSVVAERMRQQPSLSSIAVGVVRGRDTLLMRGYGLVDREGGRIATAHTVYQIGSVSKQVAALAIMRLVDQGRLRLDDDVTRYLPRPELRGRGVTVRHLLNHTAGIHNYTDSSWLRRMGEDFPPDSILDLVAGRTFDFEPGARYSYSNTGYVMLGMIVEKISGRPYATFVQQELFDPLGLREMYYCPSHTTDPLAAKGYRFKDGQFVPAAFIHMSQPHAAGAICASVADFLTFARAFHNGRIVSAESYRQMTTPATLNNGNRLTYGFGVQVGQLGDRRSISHGGSINGFRSSQMYLPQDSLWVVAFTNSEASPGGVANELARITLGLPPAAAPGGRGGRGGRRPN